MDGEIRITLNGTERQVAAGGTVLSLLTELGLESVPVLVEWNGTALFPREFGSSPITEGGRMEIIRIVAGG